MRLTTRVYGNVIRPDNFYKASGYDQKQQNNYILKFLNIQPLQLALLEL